MRLGRGALLASTLIISLGWLAAPARLLGQQEQSAPIPQSGSDPGPSKAAIEAPSAKKPSPPPHAFFDRKNILLFSGIAAMRGMDYASTRNFQARGRTEILLPDDVVNNSAGFAALEAASTATSVGISYLFHRTGHHKMERWLSVGHIGVTAFGVIWNYSLKSKHP